MSIVYMALENIVGAGSCERRWLIAFAFGLVHGFGFSFALRETLQFAGSHLLTSLLVLQRRRRARAAAGARGDWCRLLDLLFRFVVPERIGTIILSALVAHTAWHWMVERGSALGQYRPSRARRRLLGGVSLVDDAFCGGSWGGVGSVACFELAQEQRNKSQLPIPNSQMTPTATSQITPNFQLPSPKTPKPRKKLGVGSWRFLGVGSWSLGVVHMIYT